VTSGASRTVKVRLAQFQSESPTPPNGVVGGVVGTDVSAPLYSPETKRLLKDRGVFYGAETASISTARPVSVALTF
jgi:hypothetical protein